KQRASDLLWKQLGRACAGIKFALQGDCETRLLGSRTVVGEVETFLHQSVDVGSSQLAPALTRVQEHVLDNRIGALAVLDDLAEIIFQQVGQLVSFLAAFLGKALLLQRVPEFVGQLDRKS